MKYFIIRDTSEADSRLLVFNSRGKEIFKILGEISGSNQKLIISNMDNEQLAAVTSSPFAFPHFRVRLGRRHIIFIMTPQAKTPMMIYGINVSFDGILLTGEYTLKDHNGNIIATQKHGWCKMGECHDLEIFNKDYSMLAFAVSAAISVYYGIYDKDNAITT